MSNLTHPIDIKSDIKKVVKKLKKEKWYYEYQMLGYNYRINDIQSALGIFEIKNLSKPSERLYFGLYFIVVINFLLSE